MGTVIRQERKAQNEVETLNGYLVWSLWIVVFGMIALGHLGTIVFTARSVGWRQAMAVPQVMRALILLYGVGMPLLCAGIGVFSLAALPPQELATQEEGMIVFAGVCGALLLGAFTFAEFWRWRPLLLTWRATTLLLAKRYPDALAILQRLVRLRPKIGTHFANEAIAFYHLGRLAEALFAVEKSLMLRRFGWLAARATVEMIKANILFALQRPFEALAINEQALRLVPNNGAIWALQSFYMAQIGRYPESLACGERALALAPKSAQRKELSYLVLAAQANALNGLSRFAEALAVAQRAIPLNATPVRAYLACAIALTQLGRADDARAAAEQGLRAVEERLAIEPSVPVHAETATYQSALLRILGRADEANAAAARSQALYVQMANPNPGMAPAL